MMLWKCEDRLSHYRLLHRATILQTPEVPFTLFSLLAQAISITYKDQASFLISLNFLLFEMNGNYFGGLSKM